jgi:hypothetical protein
MVQMRGGKNRCKKLEEKLAKNKKSNNNNKAICPSKDLYGNSEKCSKFYKNSQELLGKICRPEMDSFWSLWSPQKIINRKNWDNWRWGPLVLLLKIECEIAGFIGRIDML